MNTQQNTSLHFMRLYYLSWFIASGALFPFANLFFVERGLSGTEIGLLSTVGALVSMVAAPIWGRWNDTSANPRRLLQLALLGSALLHVWLSQQFSFWWIVCIIALEPLLGAGIEPLSSSAAVAAADSQKSGFGAIRLWGSIGWALGAPVTGWLVESLGLTVPFFGYAIFLLVGALLLRLIEFRRPGETSDAVGTKPRLPLLELAALLMRSRAMFGLGLALVVLWLSGFGIHQFEGVYMKQLGAGEMLIGLSNAIALLEIAAMLWADRLIRQYGAARVLHISVLLQALGFGVVLVSPSVETILFSRLVTSLQYSFYIVALTTYMVEGAPNGQSSTVLAFYNITLRGVITVVGGPLSGILFDWLGAYWLYLIALGGVVLGWFILWVTGRKPAAVT